MKYIQISILAFIVLFISSCNKDEETVSETYQNLIGNWEPTNLGIAATIDGKSFVQYLVDDLGFSQDDAEDAAQEFANWIASGLTGNIEFKRNKIVDKSKN